MIVDDKIYILYDKMRNVFTLQKGSDISNMTNRFEILTSPSGVELSSFSSKIMIDVMKDLFKEAAGSPQKLYNDKNRLIKFICKHQVKFK